MSRAAARDRERRRKHRRRKHRERAGRASGWWAAGVAVRSPDGAAVAIAMPPMALARDPDRAMLRAAVALRHIERAIGPCPRPYLHTLPVTDALAAAARLALELEHQRNPDPALRRAAAAGLGLDPEAEALDVPPVLRAQRVPRDAHCRPARPGAVLPWETP